MAIQWRILIAVVVALIAVAPSGCGGGEKGGDQQQLLPYEASGGVNGDHAAYVWPHGRATYVVSVHGRENGPCARAMMEALIAEVAGG